MKKKNLTLINSLHCKEHKFEKIIVVYTTVEINIKHSDFSNQRGSQQIGVSNRQSGFCLS